jgi:hypothetical protein
VPEVRRPLPQDEREDRQVQRELNAGYRQHGFHEHITIFEGLGFSFGLGHTPVPE